VTQGRRKVLNNGGHILTENENKAPSRVPKARESRRRRRRGGGVWGGGLPPLQPTRGSGGAS